MSEKIKQRTVAILTLILSIVLFISSFAILYLTFNPIIVIKDWTISTDKLAYFEGGTVVMTSRFEKRYDMKGSINRRLSCDNGKNVKEYNPTTLEASSEVGKRELISSATIPYKVIDNLPQRCHFVYDVTYNTFGFKSTGRSNVFTVNQK